MSRSADISLRALHTLHTLEVLDTGQEEAFQELARMAAAACGTPIALVSLLDVDRQWFKANVGLEGVEQTPRDVAFCGFAVEQSALYVVPDARLDPQFAQNPLVQGEPNIRFYAGAPLALSNGARVGTLCVIDRQPRELDGQQRQVLAELAATAAQWLESRLKPHRALEAARLGLHPQQATAHASDAVVSVDPGNVIVSWTAAAERLYGYPAGEVIGRHASMLIPEELRDGERLAFQRIVVDGVHQYESRRRRRDGSVFAASITLAVESDADGQVQAVTKFVRALGDHQPLDPQPARSAA